MARFAVVSLLQMGVMALISGLEAGKGLIIVFDLDFVTCDFFFVRSFLCGLGSDLAFQLAIESIRCISILLRTTL